MDIPILSTSLPAPLPRRVRYPAGSARFPIALHSYLRHSSINLASSSASLSLLRLQVFWAYIFPTSLPSYLRLLGGRFGRFVHSHGPVLQPSRCCTLSGLLLIYSVPPGSAFSGALPISGPHFSGPIPLRNPAASRPPLCLFIYAFIIFLLTYRTLTFDLYCLQGFPRIFLGLIPMPLIRPYCLSPSFLFVLIVSFVIYL